MWQILLESISDTSALSLLCFVFANVLTLRIWRVENWTENWELRSPPTVYCHDYFFMRNSKQTQNIPLVRQKHRLFKA